MSRGGGLRMLNKVKGGLFGLAIGDALGATTEFMTEKEIRDKYGTITEIRGGGPWELKAEETTDDTAMTFAVVKGIMDNSIDPIESIGRHFLLWEKSKPKDIGVTIQKTIEHFTGNWFRAAEEVHFELRGKSAGNGSLMRCLPIALAYSDIRKINELSARQSKMTHYDDTAAEACVIYNRVASRVLTGESLEAAIWAEIRGTRYDLDYSKEPGCPPDGFVFHTMEWVLYWLLNSKTFEEVVIGAANKGYDSDTIAAIAGGLKGLEVGFDRLPAIFVEALLERKVIEDYMQKCWLRSGIRIPFG